MNPTHNQDSPVPEPRDARDRTATDLVGLLINGSRFGVGIAPAVATAEPATTPGETERDGYAITDAGLRALAKTGTDAVEAPGTAPQVLRSAARYLERYGWIQGVYYDPTATVFTPAACMVGAIGMVCYGGPVEAPAQHFDDPGFLDFEEAVLHLDRYLLVEDGSESYEFNDARGRTVDQVTDVLRKAAARPVEELIDAIRAIEAHNADQANTQTCPACDGPLVHVSGNRYWCAAEDAKVTTYGGDGE